jgi:predicted aldo/keto reductase-like oxidoreductase
MQTLALSYALYNKNIDNVLIGVENNTQLLKNIESIQNHQKAFDFINNSVFVKETELLNPVNWK